MTTSQLETALPGLAFNQWITLENFCKGIGLTPDFKIFINPTGKQFYFDSSNKLLFVRDTSVMSEINARIIHGTNTTIHSIKENKDITVTMDAGGFEDSEIGRYHSVFTFDSIFMTF